MQYSNVVRVMQTTLVIQRISEHQYSAIGKPRREEHGLMKAFPDKCFTVLKKFKSKFDCLLYEMMFIKENSLMQNIQTDLKLNCLRDHQCSVNYCIT